MSDFDPNKVPDDCSMCGNPFEDAHPYALAVVDVHTPQGGHWETGRTFVCAACIVPLAEFLCPGQADNPRWTSEKDQYMANLRNYQKKKGS